MWTRQQKKSPLRHLITPAVLAAFAAYFSFHALTGNYGLESKHVYEAHLARLQDKLEMLKSEQETLQRRVAALSDGTLQRDMIDEQARRQLGLVLPNEVIMYRDRDNAGMTAGDVLRRVN